MNTRTGSFPLGFRRTRLAWQKDMAALADWAARAGFSVIDLPAPTDADADALKAAGLGLVSVDLAAGGDLVAPDAAARKAAVEANTEHLKTWAGRGVKAFFTCVIPRDPTIDPKQSMA